MIDKILGKKLLPVFRKVDRGISPTQRSALESGTVGFEGSIFAGRPDWVGLFSTPAPTLSDEEQSFIDNEVETLCAMIDDWDIRDTRKDLPPEVWSYLKDNRFFGMIIPKEYGGLGFSNYAHSCVVSKIATRSSTVAATVMVPNSLGPGELLLHYGTDAQKDHYLPRLADGRDVPCFSLTSPQAGSDATNLKDEGTVFKGDDGKLYIRLNWEKRYITLAPVATVLGLAFRLKDPERLLGGVAVPGITLALIPRETPGITVGNRHRPMGTPFQNGPHWGQDVIVPVDAIIGGPKQAGRGWDMLVDCLSIGRSISLPGSSAGLARYATRVTGAYAAVRQQFGTPLLAMEGVQEPLARIGGLTYMIDSARLLPLQDMDMAIADGKSARPAVASAILKYHMTQSARTIAIDAMDIHGGKGVVEGPNNPVGALYQGIPVGITVEGANIMTRSLMIFGQGAFMAHPFVMKEMEAARNSDISTCGRLGRQHAFHTVRNGLRSVFMGAAEKLSCAPDRPSSVRHYTRRIDRLSAAFAFAQDVSMATLQGSLKWRERTSALLGDVASNLYLGAQVLRRWSLEGRHEDDRPLMQWAAMTCIHRAETALYEAIRNHPSATARKILSPVCFPLGRTTAPPPHALDRLVADLICTPGPVRDNLTTGVHAGMYVPRGCEDYVARLERTLRLSVRGRPYEMELQRAVKTGKINADTDHLKMIDSAHEKGILSDSAADLLRTLHQARTDIIQVDYFPNQWHGPAQHNAVPPPPRR